MWLWDAPGRGNDGATTVTAADGGRGMVEEETRSLRRTSHPADRGPEHVSGTSEAETAGNGANRCSSPGLFPSSHTKA